MWPPFMTEESTLPFYSPDACRLEAFSGLSLSLISADFQMFCPSLYRSLELVYQRSGETKGIPLFRFVAPKTLFANGTDYAPNEGFCPCRQSGLLNVSSCRHGESDRFWAVLVFLVSVAASSLTSLLSRLSGLHLPSSLFQRWPGSAGLRAGTLSNWGRAWPFHRYSPSEYTNTHTHHAATAIKQQVPAVIQWKWNTPLWC